MISTKPFTFDRVIRLIIGLTVLVLLFLLLKRLSNVLLPFIIAWLLAYMLDPIVRFFQYKLRLRNRLISVILTILFAGGVLTGLGFIIVPIVSDEIAKLYEITSTYSKSLNIDTFLPVAWQNEISQYFLTIDVNALLQNQSVMDFLKKVAPQVWDLLNGSLSLLLGLTVVIIIFLYMFFILLEYERVTEGMVRIIPPKYRPLITEILHDMEVGMNRYFRGQALVAFIVGVLCAIGFSIISLPMAVLFGLLIGVLTLVPYLKVVAIVPGLMLGFLQSVETGQNYGTILLSIAVVFFIVQAIEDMVISPIIMGKVTGLNPAVIILALSIWGSLMGMLGLIIALPLTTLVVSYYKRFVLNVTPANEVENNEELAKEKENS
jgi:predicted PurR-regulated permease PerM